MWWSHGGGPRSLNGGVKKIDGLQVEPHDKRPPHEISISKCLDNDTSLVRKRTKRVLTYVSHKITGLHVQSKRLQ